MSTATPTAERLIAWETTQGLLCPTCAEDAELLRDHRVTLTGAAKLWHPAPNGIVLYSHLREEGRRAHFTEELGAPCILCGWGCRGLGKGSEGFVQPGVDIPPC